MGGGVAQAGLFVGLDAAVVFVEAREEALDGVTGQSVEVAQDEAGVLAGELDLAGEGEVRAGC
ncbi:MAG: hypothetical protein Q7Q73_15655 [Verrucomicrobiota bacterium JB024]|nr:hypothetical protein [Verrucomicrobiota bacterium JB024]